MQQLISWVLVLDQVAPKIVPPAAPQASVFNMAVVVEVLLVGFLVTILLLGGFLIMSLGLLTKRQEDRIGQRTPSDLGILKSGVWPEEPDAKRELPALDEEEEEEFEKEAS
jgi:hypothetical protein